MRVLSQIPEIENKIKDGSLSLSNIAKVGTYCRQNNLPEKSKKEVLLRLENKSTRECEKILLEMTPGAGVLPQEKTRQVTPTYMQVTLNISNELADKLEKLKCLLSHKRPHMSQADLIEELADLALKKLDPGSQRSVSVARKVEMKLEATERPTRKCPTKGPLIKRQTISKELKRKVWTRDCGHCSFISKNGVKCQSPFRLQVDHRIPVSCGGTNDLENLRLLCGEAVRILGMGKMKSYLSHWVQAETMDEKPGTF